MNDQDLISPTNLFTIAENLKKARLIKEYILNIEPAEA